MRPLFRFGLKVEIAAEDQNYFTDDAVSASRPHPGCQGNELFAVGRFDSSDLVESIARSPEDRGQPSLLLTR